MNWKTIALILVVFIVVAAIAYKMYGTSTSGFQSGAGGTGTSFTMYYANWCPHCKTAKPEFEKLIAKSPMNVGSSSVTIRMVEQGEDKSGEMKKKNVGGFPTFLLETVDGQTIEHKGPRSTDAYLEFLNTTLGGGVI
jgi:thiol-disulfide isomerase/thioredoxin